MRLVTIIGTDGSGKTSLSDLYAASLREDGLRAERVWLGAESQLMLPVRAVLKRSWNLKRRSQGQARDPERADREYSDEIAQKNHVANRFGRFTGAYVALAWSDYRAQTAVKFRRSKDLDVLIADRYLFDVAVNIGLTLGWNPGEVVAFCQRRLAHLPLPQGRFFLRVTPEVSMSRKDDIPDISYLRLRLAYYDAIASAFGFEVLDGERPLEENLARLREATEAELRKPYVHYVHANNADVGGADRVLTLMAQHARSPHGDASPVRAVVSLRKRTRAAEMHTAFGTPVIVANFVRPQTSGGLTGVVRSAVLTPLSLVHFVRLFGRERPDIVHVNDLYDIIPAGAARLLHIPVVYHIRMIKSDDLTRRLFAWLIPRMSSASVSVSSAVRDHYFGATSVSDTRALVIHDLGNEQLTAEDDRARDVPGTRQGAFVLMVGRVEPWKGQHIFLDAVESLPQEMRDSNTFGLVGGPVPGQLQYFEMVQDRARALGVEFLGERSDVPELLSSADISVHCSVEPDPFPGVVVESLLAGAFTIGADAGGVRELIPSTAVGRRTEPGNAVALADALHEALTAPAEAREATGTAARSHVLSLIDPRKVDSRLADLYHRLAPRGAAELTTPLARKVR